MLRELAIRNFAIIDDLRISFADGLTILSGETGAGKSIIIQAVNLLLGSRASAKLIRTGQETAELEAEFDIPRDSDVAKAMGENDLDPSDGLIVRRIISSNERHRIYINGRLSTQQLLTQLTGNLASISGQHAHQLLLDESYHLLLLDQYGGLLPLRHQFQDTFQQMLPLLKRLAELEARQARQEAQKELLDFQYREIRDAELRPEEEDALEQERSRLKNATHLYAAVQKALDTFYEGQGAIHERINEITKELDRFTRIDDALKKPVQEMDTIAIQVHEVTDQLRDYLGAIDMDASRLDTVEARISHIQKLKRKYDQPDLQGVLDHLADIESELNGLVHLTEEIAATRKHLQALASDLGRMATELSAQRQIVAKRLSLSVETELAQLKMPETRFQIELAASPPAADIHPYLAVDGKALTPFGFDKAVFLISPNVGEKLKPLASIASGGELSRVVLALKAILADTESVATVIFDEVDAGIGGGVAEVVGKKLAALARHHQVICITHLPQIAIYGDVHYQIAKTIQNGRTKTGMHKLNQKQRVEEVARMLGGETLTPTTLKHARELLNSRSPSTRTLKEN